MIMLHKFNSLLYCKPQDIKAIELVKKVDGFNTKLICRIAGNHQIIYVKESPTYILRRMGEETRNSD